MFLFLFPKETSSFVWTPHRVELCLWTACIASRMAVKFEPVTEKNNSSESAIDNNIQRKSSEQKNENEELKTNDEPKRKRARKT